MQKAFLKLNLDFPTWELELWHQKLGIPGIFVQKKVFFKMISQQLRWRFFKKIFFVKKIVFFKKYAFFSENAANLAPKDDNPNLNNSPPL